MLDRSPDKGDLMALQASTAMASKAATGAVGHAELGESRSCIRVSVVIPTLNEAENLQHVLPYIPEWVDEVVLVDGHSTDETVAVARELYPTVRIVQQDGKGKGDALRVGFAAATGDIIITLDADGSTDPAEIPAFVDTLLAGADFAKGSRFLKGGGTVDMPLYRRVGNWGLLKLVQVLFGGHYTDLCYGYNALWARAVPMLRLDCDGFEIETLMNVRALQVRLRVLEVPSFEAKRVHGEGRLRTIPDGWRVLRTIVREWGAGAWRSMGNRGVPGRALAQSWNSAEPDARVPVQDYGVYKAELADAAGLVKLAVVGRPWPGGTPAVQHSRGYPTGELL
jgi:hypothetical protein